MQDEMVELSIHSLLDTLGCSTMKVEGTINDRRLQLLIDLGSTHKFLDISIADNIWGQTELVPSMKVLVVNGCEMNWEHICKEFSWNMQGKQFTTSVFLVSLESYHMILGVQWLTTLSDILWNFRNLMMKFAWGKELCELKWNRSSPMHLSSVSKLNKLIVKKDEVALVQFCSLSLQATTKSHSFLFSAQVTERKASLELMEQLLTWSVDVFKDPHRLPPLRMIDHRVFKEEVTPISLRPYRCLSPQKMSLGGL